MSKSWLYEALSRHSPEMWPLIGYIRLCVDIDLNFGRYLVLPSWQYLKSQSVLCQAVYGKRQNSNLSLYCTPHYSEDSATVAPFLYKLYSYSHYLCALLPTAHCSTIYTINTTTHSLLNLSLGCKYTAICAIANCTGKSLGFSNILSQFAHHT